MMPKLPQGVSIACVFLTAFLSQAQIRGVVHGASGEPVTGAWVYGIGAKLPRAVTRGDGSFDLNYSPRVIHVFKRGYRPFSRLVPAETNALSLVIEKTAATEWNIPSCATDDQLFGEHWKFKIERVARKIGQTVDDSEYSIEYPGSPSKPVMSLTIGSAIAADWYDATDVAIENSIQFEERHIQAGNDVGIDARGKLGIDKYWRSVQSWYVDARYYNVPADAAKYFDAIIDSACFEAPLGNRTR